MTVHHHLSRSFSSDDGNPEVVYRDSQQLVIVDGATGQDVKWSTVCQSHTMTEGPIIADVDGDGFGDPNNSTQACSAPAGFVVDNTDCDDSNNAIYPGAIEVCDGIDNNCDGNIDEGGLNTFYADTDGDGLNDGEEVNTHNTDPNDDDSDGDGLADWWEMQWWSNLVATADGDADGDSDQRVKDDGLLEPFDVSLNMISLFGLIMALGIIVDDAIVVGEDALAHYQMGEPSLLAAEGGARRMLAPVMASSLTTISAFLPLMLIGGIIGNILSAIPLVIVSVILASLIESFLVLPGHLRHAFLHMHKVDPRSLRARLDRGFFWFRDRLFRPLVSYAIRYRGITVSAAVACLAITVGLLAGGRLQLLFSPSI